jgi:hypothetical protein
MPRTGWARGRPAGLAWGLWALTLVQVLVERRFNRRRYDAGRTVDHFAARLRDQVDLQALHGELLAVVDQTVAPTQASRWLQAPRSRG